jgi:hypothetical protein
MPTQPDEKNAPPSHEANEERGLPQPRPAGQPEREDKIMGDEGGTGFYGPASEEEEPRGTD